jgi:hypothetical protein
MPKRGALGKKGREAHAEGSGESKLSPSQVLDYFKYYEDAAEKAKTHAWSQTTWILALNAGIMAFSVDFYANHGGLPGFRLIECMSAGVGIALCLFLVYLLEELGGHISHYWSVSNTLAASTSSLTPFISATEAMEARQPGYKAAFPAFCRRLQALAGLFLVGHAAWLAIVLRGLPR